MIHIILGIILASIGVIALIFAILSIIGIAENFNDFGVDWGWQVGFNARNVFTLIVAIISMLSGVALLVLHFIGII